MPAGATAPWEAAGRCLAWGREARRDWGGPGVGPWSLYPFGYRCIQMRHDDPTGGSGRRGAIRGMRSAPSCRVERLLRALDATPPGPIGSRTAKTAQQDRGSCTWDSPSWGPWPL
jgi:hypothetical protein